MPTDAAEFRWEPSDPLARAQGEPAAAHAALLDYAKRIGPDRSLEKLRAFYGRLAAKAACQEQAKQQPDLFGPLDAAPARKAGKVPGLKTLRGWFGRYRWEERAERWLGLQRVVAESGGAGESARMFASGCDSYREAERAAWEGWEAAMRDGKPDASFLRIVLQSNDSLRRMLDLDRWARVRRDDRSGDVEQTVMRGLVAGALKFADEIAERLGEDAANEYLGKVRGLCPDELREAANGDLGA